jgi:hypothetical protein
MYNTRKVADDKQEKAQCNKEDKIRARSEVDNHGVREPLLKKLALMR